MVLAKMSILKQKPNTMKKLYYLILLIFAYGCGSESNPVKGVYMASYCESMDPSTCDERMDGIIAISDWREPSSLLGEFNATLFSTVDDYPEISLQARNKDSIDNLSYYSLFRLMGRNFGDASFQFEKTEDGFLMKGDSKGDFLRNVRLNGVFKLTEIIKIDTNAEGFDKDDKIVIDFLKAIAQGKNVEEEILNFKNNSKSRVRIGERPLVLAEYILGIRHKTPISGYVGNISGTN